MSTPPFVDLPQGSSVEWWPVRGSLRAVMHTGLRDTRSWAVLVPGFTGSKEDFIAVLPLLAESGVGALSYDQLGQFESDGSPHAADYALDLLAADLAEVIADARRRFDFDGPVHLVGHSFGGLVSQRALIDGVDVASFTALCTGPGALPRERHGGLADLVDALGHHDPDEIWAVMRAMDLAAGVGAPAPPIADFLRRRWLANHPVSLQQFGRLLMEQESLTTQMVDTVTSRIPATVMWGENDDAWPIPVQAQMARDWGAPGIQLDGLGHSPNAQDPAALVAALLRCW